MWNTRKAQAVKEPPKCTHEQGNTRGSLKLGQTTRASHAHSERQARQHEGYNCVAHGGGRRCQHEGCLKSVQGNKGDCMAHGGGRWCQREGCPKLAQGGTGHCRAHGVGRRCQHEGCPKSAQGSTGHCKAHGGGRRCQHETPL